MASYKYATRDQVIGETDGQSRTESVFCQCNTERVKRGHH